MKDLSLTQIIEKLQEWAIDVNSDINSDWISDEVRRKSQSELQLLLIAKANLEMLASNPNSQSFLSSIKK
jgi:hypothetical protein